MTDAELVLQKLAVLRDHLARARRRDFAPTYLRGRRLRRRIASGERGK